MPEYMSEDVKRAVRCEALERAVALAGSASNFRVVNVLFTANMFEKYILNGYVEEEK
jgi:hypothetical protein